MPCANSGERKTKPPDAPLRSAGCNLYKVRVIFLHGNQPLSRRCPATRAPSLRPGRAVCLNSARPFGGSGPTRLRSAAYRKRDPRGDPSNNDESKYNQMNIYVGNLPYSVRDEELRATFEPFGKVVSAEVIFDKRTRRSRGYGFVEMSQDAEAERAITALNGTELYGRELRVDASQPKSEKPSPGSMSSTGSPGSMGSSAGREREPRERTPRTPSTPGASAAPSAETRTGIKGFFKRLFG